MSDPVHILLIDGNAEERRYYIERLLSSSPDYVVTEAASGQYALDLCDFRTIDCVILEIDLPDMSGFEVLVKLVPRVHHPEIPVVVLTRLPMRDLLELATTNGAQAALQKHVTSGDLLDKTIQQAIARVRRSRKTSND